MLVEFTKTQGLGQDELLAGVEPELGPDRYHMLYVGCESGSWPQLVAQDPRLCGCYRIATVDGILFNPVISLPNSRGTYYESALRLPEVPFDVVTLLATSDAAGTIRTCFPALFDRLKPGGLGILMVNKRAIGNPYRFIQELGKAGLIFLRSTPWPTSIDPIQGLRYRRTPKPRGYTIAVRKPYDAL